MTSVVLDPYAPIWLIAVLSALAAGGAVWLGGRGRALRLLATVLVGLAALNPALLVEEAESQPDYVLLVADASESMSVADRAVAADAVMADLREQIAAMPDVQLIETTAVSDVDGTALYAAISQAVGETPGDRLAGVIVVSDGQGHDIPEALAAIDIPAPVHAVIVGDPDRSDRRIVIKEAPVYALVNERDEPVQFTMRVEDPNAEPGERVRVSLALDGGDPVSTTAVVGEDVSVGVRIRKRGPNVVQITAEVSPEELTDVNNRTAVTVNGVRERLRVLLITGQPYSGARAWRDLLKSDPSVDLVHFTILRDPREMQFDTTPSSELSLIRFPSDELFLERLDEFDLVIFDYYKYHQGQILRPDYFIEMIRYVEERGGAILINAGPHFATNFSLYRTPLSVILPARPTRRIDEAAFRPQVSELGRAHPVTAEFALPGGEAERWGQWYRRIDASVGAGDVLLEDETGEPLLVLDRVENGRVAMVLSDHAWLWRRGVDGGGPHSELFRRLTHWLMKEPELEEERLRAEVVQGVMTVERRTVGDAPGPATVTSPTGQQFPVDFSRVEPGRYVGQVEVNETGLYAARSGELTTVAASGPVNPREFNDLRATADVLAPVVSHTGGGAVFAGADDQAKAPELRRVRAEQTRFGDAWLGLVRREVSETTAQSRTSLFPAWLAVVLALGALGGMWFREGR